jgi:hypothetical protein
MSREYHPLVKAVLDGERRVGELPPDLRADAEEALRLLGVVDRRAVTLSAGLEARVMAAVRRRAAGGAGGGERLWRWLTAPSVPPWAVGAVAAAGALVLVLFRTAARPVAGEGAAGALVPESVYVKFVLFAPDAHRVALAGTFNRWDPSVTPLGRAGAPGVWTVTIALPAGQHQYAFVVDGARWVTDPVAPSVDDGFGRRNSVVSVSRASGGGRIL